MLRSIRWHTLGALLMVACGTGTPDAATTDTGAAEATTSGVHSSGTAAPTIAGAASSSDTTTAAPTTSGAVGSSTDATSECGACVEPDVCGGGGVAGECGRPCVAVRAILFDLGETLVVPDGDRFVERPGAVAMIGELKALGMTVGIVTNTPPGYTMQDLELLLVNPGFLAQFEVVLLSSEAMSPPKPDPQIFVEAHGMLAAAPPIGEVAFVSEDLAELADRALAPTSGARAAGMLGVHLSAAPPSPLADHTIAPDQLAEIVALAQTQWLDCGR